MDVLERCIIRSKKLTQIYQGCSNQIEWVHQGVCQKAIITRGLINLNNTSQLVNTGVVITKPKRTTDDRLSSVLLDVPLFTGENIPWELNDIQKLFPEIYYQIECSVKETTTHGKNYHKNYIMYRHLCLQTRNYIRHLSGLDSLIDTMLKIDTVEESIMSLDYYQNNNTVSLKDYLMKEIRLHPLMNKTRSY